MGCLLQSVVTLEDRLRGQLLTEETISGINAGFDTFLTAMSIAYGLMVATVVLPRRFTQVAPHTAGAVETTTQTTPSRPPAAAERR